MLFPLSDRTRRFCSPALTVGGGGGGGGGTMDAEIDIPSVERNPGLE